jgi:hypothetical protein
VRFSFGLFSTADDIERAALLIADVLND